MTVSETAPATHGVITASSHEAARTRRVLRHLVPVVPVALAALPIIYGYRYRVGLDGVAFLSLARQYAEGHVAEAINGYWGPLLPWLAAPAIVLGVPPIAAGYLVVLAAAALALVGVRRVAVAVGASPLAADLCALATAPFVLGAATLGVFADLLVAALVLNALPPLLDDRWRTGRTAGLVVGAWLSAAYLAKAYALPFSIAFVPAATAAHLLAFRGSRSIAMRNTVLALGVLAVTVAAWAAVLSVHYGQFLISSSPGYNLAVVGPESAGNPIHTAGLLPPPSEHAVSGWDDPSLLPAPGGWSSNEPAEGAQRLYSNVARNITGAAAAIRDHAPALVLAGFAGGVLALRRRRFAAALALLAAAIHTGGYLVTWVEPRYLWPALLFIASLAAVLLDLPRRRWGAALAAVVLAAAVATPLIPGAALRWGAGEETRAVARLLSAHDVEGRNVASANNFQRVSIICLHARCRYYGTAARGGAPLNEQLADHHIDVYLVELPVGADTPVPDVEPDARYGNTLVYEIPNQN